MNVRTKLLSASRTIIPVLLCVLAGACAGGVRAGSDYRLDYSPTVRPQFQIGGIVDATTRKKDVDIPALMETALRKKFAELSIPMANESTDPTTDIIVINTTVLNYKEGNALARWIVPGVAPTRLDVTCDLLDGRSEKLVGTIFARGAVKGGGLYSIGAWKYIFTSIAEQIGLELVKKYKPLPPPNANDHVEAPDAQLVDEL